MPLHRTPRLVGQIRLNPEDLVAKSSGFITKPSDFSTESYTLDPKSYQNPHPNPIHGVEMCNGGAVRVQCDSEGAQQKGSPNAHKKTTG